MSHCIIMNIHKNRLLFLAAFLFIGASLLSSCGPDKKEKEDQAQREKQQDAVDTPAVAPIVVTKGKLSSTIAIPGELIPK
jgi:membrane fusion protein (multidrug efflux system)